MWRKFSGIFLLLTVASGSVVGQQLEKHFSVSNDEGASELVFNFKSQMGRCLVTPAAQNESLKVYSNKDIEEFIYDYKREVRDDVFYVDLGVSNKEQKSIGQAISLSMFGEDDETEEPYWKILLNKKQNMQLGLTYGFGDADIDLSGLGVSKLKINTGSADVNLGYGAAGSNRVIMDTMQIQVDLGTLVIRNMPKAKARSVKADVGFGTLSLDFTDKALVASEVNASVGAGDLIILVSEDMTPMKVNITDSFLCKVRVLDSFRKVKENTWVNKSYTPNAPNLVTFHVDVSMGNIIFKEK